MSLDISPEKRHDVLLAEILTDEGNSLPSFFNAVFGFLWRNCPEEIYGSTQISGEHLISQSYCKWRQRYQEKKSVRCLQSSHCEEDIVPPVVAEVVINDNESSGTRLEIRPAADGVMRTTSGFTVTQNAKSSGITSKSNERNNYFDTTNGAVRDFYAWTQTIEDLEVKVPVPNNVRRGKQARVTLQASSLEVGVQESASVWQTLVTGEFPHTIKAEESLWSLVPGEHITISLEKSEDCWWDKLLTSEDSIDLKKINAERDYASLPEEERQKIQELVWNKQQQEQGKPTSDKLKMESMLRKAWDAEGSPFRGQTYDPSLINFAGGAGFGDG